MKPETTTNPRPVWDCQTIEDELSLCAIVRFIDLRAMHQSNGTDSALNDIVVGCYTDSIWSRTEERTAYATNLRARAKAERTIANKARQTLNRVCIDGTTRAEAERLLTHYTTLADNDQGEAHDTDKATNELTATLAQDMLHHIWLELQTIKANPNRQTERAFGELCKAGREYIQNMTAVSTLDSMTTVSRPLTVAQAVYLMKKYDIDPGARPRQRWSQTAKGTSGYYTLEAKNRKRDIDPAKVDPATVANYARYNDMCVWYYENVTIPATHSAHRPAYPALDAKATATRFWNRLTPAQKVASLGLDPADNPVLYLVLHVPTTRTSHSIETMTDHDPRTADTVTESATARIDIVALANRAKLTERERTAVVALTAPEAVAKARSAYNDSLTRSTASIEKLQSDRVTAGKKPYRPGQINQLMKKAQTTADNAYNIALWCYALTKAGFTESAQRQAKAHILKRLNTALHKAPDELTPGAIDYERMMKQTRRGASAPVPRPDLVSIWCKQAEGIKPHKPVILFAESGHEPQTMTPAEVEAIKAEQERRQAEYLTAHRDDIAVMLYRREVLRAPHKPRTVIPAHDAQNSALVFWDYVLTPAERVEAVQAYEAERAEQERKRARLHKAMHETGVYTLNSTLEQWKAWTEEERAEHIRFIENFSK